VECGLRAQLCGSFVIELHGRRVDGYLPGRQGRLLVAYLVLARPQPVSREVLIDALWAERTPPSAASALSALVSKARAALGPDILRGRAELSLVAPEPAVIDVETAVAALHIAESAVALGEWSRAWPAALAARYATGRRFQPEADQPWAQAWRRRLADVHVRALECYAAACLYLGRTETPGAERAARELVEVAPLRETGHIALMRALAAQGNVAEALAAYERLRRVLREELGVDPSGAAQQLHAELLR
jgi:DNA-binding SARP family transcriptional activator